MSKKSLKERKERMDEFSEFREEIQERLKRKDYVLTVYQTGHTIMANGHPERMENPRRYFQVCSLEEIPDVINSMTRPFWTHENGLTEKEIKAIPFEEKKWGINWDVKIEPLSEEMEKSYLKASEDGFFESWRRIEAMDRRKS